MYVLRRECITINRWTLTFVKKISSSIHAFFRNFSSNPKDHASICFSGIPGNIWNFEKVLLFSCWKLFHSKKFTSFRLFKTTSTIPPMDLSIVALNIQWCRGSTSISQLFFYHSWSNFKKLKTRVSIEKPPWVRFCNHGNTGAKRELSPPHHPCFPNSNIEIVLHLDSKPLPNNLLWF